MVVDGLFGVKESRWARLHIPAITHVEYFPSHEVPIDIGVQKLMDGACRPVLINCTARVCIADAVLCRESVGAEDWQEAAAQVIRARIVHCLRSRTTLVEMTAAEEEALLHMGIDLTLFQVEDWQQTKSLTITQ